MSTKSGHISDETALGRSRASGRARLEGGQEILGYRRRGNTTHVASLGPEVETGKSQVFPMVGDTTHLALDNMGERQQSQLAKPGDGAREPHPCKESVACEAAPQDSATKPSRCEGLTDADLANLDAVFDHEIALNTQTNYRVQWNSFVAWAEGKRVPLLPADPVQVSAYLAERIQEHGHRPATLRVAASAIAFVHRNAGLDDPCSSPEVKRTLRCATRKAGKYQKQAQALTAESLAAIRSTALEPRLGRGGKLESQKMAACRGNLDIALISLMRDAMLRVSEAASLNWEDISGEADGTGRVLIRCSKTDAQGQGAVAFLSSETMAALETIKKGNQGSESVFGLRPNQIAERIKKAAQAAGLGHGFSGHSPRVGMARDLAKAGIELPSLMNAGRWRSPAMPAHYTRNEAAGKGAVAQFHGYGI